LARLGERGVGAASASLGVDHGRLFAAIEDEVRAQLLYIAEKPIEDG
jgi:hypothetical protein